MAYSLVLNGSIMLLNYNTNSIVYLAIKNNISSLSSYGHFVSNQMHPSYLIPAGFLHLCYVACMYRHLNL